MDQPRGHRRESVGRRVPNTMAERTYECVGCGGTAPSPSLELLGPPPSAAVPATAMPSKPRDPRRRRGFPSGAVATRGPVPRHGWRPAVPLQQPSGTKTRNA